jgi:uncharacterized membrane protein (DUF373 family)
MDKAPVRHPTTPPPAAGSIRPPVSRSSRDLDSPEEKLPDVAEDGLLKVLMAIIHQAVRLLAVLMTLLILWGVADVVYVFYERLIAEPFMMLTVSDILTIFGSFMAVLIAVEIFLNITVYIKYEALPIKMVIATALMAISRKIIILDFKELDWPYIVAIAAAVLSLGLTYWLISYKQPPAAKPDER